MTPMKKFWLNTQIFVANLPMVTLLLGAIIGASLPLYAGPTHAQVVKSAFAVLIVGAGWFLAQWAARKSLTKKGISHDC